MNSNVYIELINEDLLHNSSTRPCFIWEQLSNGWRTYVLVLFYIHVI